MFQVKSFMIRCYYPVLSMDKIELEWGASLVIRKKKKKKVALF